MRKLLAVALLFGMVQFGYANTDGNGNFRPALWRTSETCTNEDFVTIASAAVRVPSSYHIHSLTITSSTVNQEAYFAIFNTTTGPVGGYNPNISTSVLVELNSTLTNPMPRNYEVLLDVDISTAMTINKTGGPACTKLKWDYLVPKGMFDGIPKRP